MKALLERHEREKLTLEPLRFEHNLGGADYRDGKLSRAAWLTYKHDEFDPKMERRIKGILKARKDNI